MFSGSKQEISVKLAKLIFCYIPSGLSSYQFEMYLVTITKKNFTHLLLLPDDHSVQILSQASLLSWRNAQIKMGFQQ